MMKNTYLKAVLITLTYFLLTFILGFIISITVGNFLIENHFTFFKIINTVSYLITFLVVFLFMRNVLKDKYIHKSNLDFKLIFIILIAAFTYNIVTDPLYNIDLILSSTNYLEDEIVTSLQEKIISFINTVILVAIIEELVFRKILISILMEKGVVISLLFSSFLFSIIHINPSSLDYLPILNAFITGIISGIIFIKKGVIYSIVFHGFYNLAVFIIQIYNVEYWEIINHLNFGIVYWLSIFISLMAIFFSVYLISKNRTRQII